MPALSETTSARATAREEGAVLVVALGGAWQVTEPRPSWRDVRGARSPAEVRVRMDEVDRWDTSLLLFLLEIRKWCEASKVCHDFSALPPRVATLLGQLAQADESAAPKDRAEGFVTVVGKATQDLWVNAKHISHFVGECFIGAVRLAQHPRRFRWKDCLAEMQQCGPMAVPIVGLVSFLVGVTLSYTASIILRLVGFDIYIADIIGLAMVREVGAVMTAVVLAGRTGAAFAATLGNMKTNEEIDALETLGIPAVQFLVMPRLVALALMMPLLTLYANALGIIGGMVIAYGLLDITPMAYWSEMLTIVDLSDVCSGVIKAGAFGLIVGLAGCMRGLEAERSAAGVGRAATSAVVTAILMMVVADAIFAVVFNQLGI
jgi:phospholipid/cholesterol/gamma-HCH transport system permease protein